MILSCLASGVRPGERPSAEPLGKCADTLVSGAGMLGKTLLGGEVVGGRNTAVAASAAPDERLASGGTLSPRSCSLIKACCGSRAR